jgi:hypothetical protein
MVARRLADAGFPEPSGIPHEPGTSRSMMLASLTWFLFVLVTAVFCRPATATPDVNSLLERSIAANESDWRDESGYDHWERDDSGGVVKTYHVLMIDGTPYERLVAINDQALSSSKEQDEQQKLDKVIAKRRVESKSQRAHRLAEYQRDHDRVRAMFHELGRAFTFTLHGARRVESRTVYVLAATPRSDYTPPDVDARALAGMHAEFWIDAQSFRWVKVTAEVHRPVSVFGLFVRLEPGTVLELEKAPVGDGIWLTSRLAIRSQTKILSFLSHRTYEDDRYYNYAKASR